MLRGEFETLIGKEVTDEEYAVIDKVYTYHPAIKISGGKEQIADIYKTMGIVVIKNMEETADFMIKLKEEINKYTIKINKLNIRIQKLKYGNIEYERCIRDLQALFDISDDYEVYKRGKEQLNKRFGVVLVKEALKEFNENKEG